VWFLTDGKVSKTLKQEGNFIWIVSHDKALYRELKNARAFLIMPTEEELRQRIRQGDAFNVLAPYGPPTAFNDLFIVEKVQTDIFSEQEKWYIRQRILAGEIREKVEMEVLERKTGVKIYKPSTTFEQVIGMRKLRELVEILKVFPFGSPFFYKTILLVGVPGTGKSLTAKAIAGETERYLVELNLAKMLETERPTTYLDFVLTALEKMRVPCVLWIDEIEKALGEGSKEKKLIGRLLTILQEFHTPTGYRINGFFWITANDISILAERHPELFRSGRVDRLYFIDFPTSQRAREIAEFYLFRFLKKNPYGKENSVGEGLLKILRNWKQFHQKVIDHFLEFAKIYYNSDVMNSTIYKTPDGEVLFVYTPAEIEQVMRRFFEKSFEFLYIPNGQSSHLKTLLTDRLNRFYKFEMFRFIEEAVKDVRPIGTTMKEGIEKMKGFAEGRFLPAD